MQEISNVHGIRFKKNEAEDLIHNLKHIDRLQVGKSSRFFTIIQKVKHD